MTKMLMGLHRRSRRQCRLRRKRCRDSAHACEYSLALALQQLQGLRVVAQCGLAVVLLVGLELVLNRLPLYRGCTLSRRSLLLLRCWSASLPIL